jgi:hypothetical protein
MQRVKRIAIVIAIQLAAAALSLLNLLHLKLGNLLAPSQEATDVATQAAVGAIVVASIAAPVAAAKGKRWFAAAVAATLIAGFVPRIVDAVTRHADIVARRAEDGRIEAEFLRDLAARTADVAARIADRRSYTPDEALDFVWFVDQADLSYRGLADYSPAAFALLQQALERKIVDPNGRVQDGPLEKFRGAPLFLYFYESRIRPTVRVNAVNVKEWRLLELLVRNGADLALAEAAPLKEDLQKTPVPGASDRFMRLQ